MKRKLLALLVVCLMIPLAGCGGSADPLAGTWTGEDELGAVAWIFDGKGKCSMENDFGKQEGTYSVENDQLKVKLELWDKEQIHKFTVKDDLLSFEPTDANPYAPGYKDLKKKK